MNITDPNGTDLDFYTKLRLAAPDVVIVDKVITPIWYIIGLICNAVSAKIWLSRHMRKTNSSAIYLGSIAVIDIVFVFIHFWLELQNAWGINTYNMPLLCELINFANLVPQYLTPLLILAFTFERFIAICFPFLRETFCSVKKAVISVGILSTLSVAVALVQVVFWTYSMEVCFVRENLLQFYSIWTWVTEMLIFAVVPVIVLILNILVIREINRIAEFQTSFGQQDRSRGSSQTSTVTLLSVSFYLICTLLPSTIVYALQTSIEFGDPSLPHEEWAGHPSWTSYLMYYRIRKIVEEICMSNYACYGIIYYITSGYFRDEVHKLWCLKKFCGKKNGKKSMESTQYTTVATPANV